MSNVNLEYIERFDLFLRNVRGCANNSTVKYMQNFHSIIALGLKHDWLKNDPFSKYESKIQPVEVLYLTEDEVELIAAKEFDIERLNIIRDWFIFACYTGYAYADIVKLNTVDITKHIDGEYWVFTKRIKTKIQSDVMLLPPAIEIINKYKSHPECIAKNSLLPCRSNQRINGYLKEIADLCGLNKRLHFYMARHTFATMMISQGVPIETVSKMMGHKRLSTTQIYARVLNRKVSDDMKILKAKHYTDAADTSAKEVNS